MRSMCFKDFCAEEIDRYFPLEDINGREGFYFGAEEAAEIVL